MNFEIYNQRGERISEILTKQTKQSLKQKNITYLFELPKYTSSVLFSCKFCVSFVYKNTKIITKTLQLVVLHSHWILGRKKQKFLTR